jgi:hypothetical protein
LEAKWQQRSSIRWNKLGDNNTSYFHSVTTARRKGNFISQIQDQTDSNVITDTQSIQTLFDHYYKELPGSRNETHVETHTIPSLTPNIDLSALAEAFIELEIKNTVTNLAQVKHADQMAFQRNFSKNIEKSSENT